MSIIIGFGHVAGVGKDTAAAALCRDLGFERRSFAAKLKEFALECDPQIIQTATTNVGIGKGGLKWIVQGSGPGDQGWQAAKNQFPGVRTFLQKAGAAARTVFGESFWIDQVLDGTMPDRLVISDVRYENEAEAIKALGGYVIKIQRPGRTAGGHLSETELAEYDGWDAVVENNGSVQELEQKIVELVQGWLPKEKKDSGR